MSDYKTDVVDGRYCVGDIFQIDPAYKEVREVFKGQFIVATEIYTWGIQGYLAFIYPAEDVVRFKEMTYLRINYEGICLIGPVKWFIKIPVLKESSGGS